jgi:hypothetical protein
MSSLCLRGWLTSGHRNDDHLASGGSGFTLEVSPVVMDDQVRFQFTIFDFGLATGGGQKTEAGIRFSG